MEGAWPDEVGSVEGAGPGERAEPAATVKPKETESIGENPAKRDWSEGRERFAESMWPEKCPACEVWSLYRAEPEEG